MGLWTAPAALAPVCSPLSDGSLPPQYNADFCHLPPGWLPTSPGLLAPLVSNFRGTAGSPEEEEDEEEYDRESRVVTHSSLSPWPPPCPAAPTCGCWRWVEMETQWGRDGRNEEQQGDGKPSPRSTGAEPSSLWGLSMSFPRPGQAQKGTRGCHWAVPGRDTALATPAGGPVIRGRSVVLARLQWAEAGEDGLLAGTRDSPRQG